MKSLGGLVMVAICASAGCIASNSVTCADGRVCPEDTVCVSLATANPPAQECLPPGAVSRCAGLADNAPCDGGICHDGACIAPSCGNGFVDPGEMCDDSNHIAGDGCSADCTSDETCGNGVLDGIALEQCDDGNHISNDGCDDKCRIEAPRWSATAVDSITPRQAAMAFDTGRDQAVLFGGTNAPNTIGAALGDTWVWNGAGWKNVSPPSNSPSPRFGAAMAYDAAHHVVVLFGGLDANLDTLDDTWLWDGQTWRSASPVGAPPQARTGAAMAYDGHIHRIVLFGGEVRQINGSTLIANDTWTWDGTSWSPVTSATLPAARAEPAMSYDPLRDQIVMFGGFTLVGTTQTALTDTKTYVFDGASWQGIAPPASPPQRWGARAGWDAQSHTTVLFGGHSGGDLQDTWQWTGSTWTMPTLTAKPSSRSMFALASDPVRGVLVFGGTGDVVPMTWRWQNGAWANATPPALSGGDAREVAIEPFGRRSVVVYDTGFTWEPDGGSWLLAAAELPETLALLGLAYDGARNEVIAFGGEENGIPSSELYTFDGSTWADVTPATGPTPRIAPLVYDPHRDRIVLFGGVDGNGMPQSDTWEWDGTSWLAQSPVHVPPARSAHAIAYDPIRQVVVMFGGDSSTTPGTIVELGDTWTWDGTDWTEVSPQVSPSARCEVPLVWNPDRERLTLFGGTSQSNAFEDTWEWDGATWAAVVVGTAPEARSDPSMFVSPSGRLELFSGQLTADGFSTTDSWELAWTSDSPPETCTQPLDLDGDGLAGCADPDCWYACSPQCPPGVACPASAPTCGDGICDPSFETCRMCPQDCGACTGVCGDNICDPGETCPGDC